MRKTIALLLILIVISCFIFAEGNTEQMDQDESLTTLFAELIEQQQYKQDHYYELAQPTQVLETLYTALGPDVVSYVEYEVPETQMQVIKIWYPSELAENTYPAVIFVNGTGVTASQYTAVFRHLASWGFIAVGTEDPSTGSGESTNQTLLYLLGLNDNPDSPLFGKVDTSAIGLCGHSQGGAGVFSALTINAPSIYKTAVSLSPTHEETAWLLGWQYRLDLIQIPILMVAGTAGEFETQSVIPIEKMIAMYDKIPSSKAMMRRIGAEHGEMLYSADAYVTAWMLWQLKCDSRAAEVFIVSNPELLANETYQDQRIDI